MRKKNNVEVKAHKSRDSLCVSENFEKSMLVLSKCSGSPKRCVCRDSSMNMDLVYV